MPSMTHNDEPHISFLPEAFATTLCGTNGIAQLKKCPIQYELRQGPISGLVGKLLFESLCKLRNVGPVSVGCVNSG